MEVMSSLVLELLEDPYLSIDPKTISGKISWWAMVLGGVLCVNGLLTFSMVVWFSPKCLSWMSFRILTTFGYFAGALLLAFVTFKAVYALILLVARGLFKAVGHDLYHRQFDSWRTLNVILVAAACIAKSSLLGLPIDIPTFFVITSLVNGVAAVLAGMRTAKIEPPSDDYTKRVDVTDQALRAELLARCHKASYSVLAEKPEENDWKAQHLIQLVLYGLEKGVSIEAIKLLCTNPVIQEIYQPSSMPESSQQFECYRITSDDPRASNHQAFSEVCEVLSRF